MTQPRKYHDLQAKAHRKAAEAWRAIDERKAALFAEAHDFFSDAHLYEADRYPDSNMATTVITIGFIVLAGLGLAGYFWFC